MAFRTSVQNSLISFHIICQQAFMRNANLGTFATKVFEPGLKLIDRPYCRNWTSDRKSIVGFKIIEYFFTNSCRRNISDEQNTENSSLYAFMLGIGDIFTQKYVQNPILHACFESRIWFMLFVCKSCTKKTLKLMNFCHLLKPCVLQLNE